ncbi:hypothetical protein [Roseobacter sp. S98]|uniref:hypothetical protein n=1 Tax=Roseobacter algicola (ex Choi et al. 2025) (nom. illeg.) TaxID=3092138 RepID=UPI003F5191A5
MNTFKADFEAEKKVMMAYMQRHPMFTNAEVLDQVGGPTVRRNHFLRTLRKEGRMKLVTREGGTPFYSLLKTEERLKRAAKKRRTPEGAIWSAMRAMGRFTQGEIVSSLAATSEPATEADLRKYCSALLDAGYLKVLQKARPMSGRPARYMLLRDTGPLPPEIRRMQVLVDTNEDRVAHVRGARL